MEPRSTLTKKVYINNKGIVIFRYIRAFEYTFFITLFTFKEVLCGHKQAHRIAANLVLMGRLFK